MKISVEELEQQRKQVIVDFKNKKIISFDAIEKLKALDEQIKDARRGRGRSLA